jgi:predicted ribosome quality control (RQC) complex YloA/Tae2 family protein
MEERELQLDTRLTAYENAGAHFQRAKEAEERARGIRSAIEQTRGRIAALETTRAEKAESKIEPERRLKRGWYQAFHWCLSSEGFLIVGGRDASTNEILIKKHTSPTDLVFHSDASGAPFVVVKTENRQPGEITIREAAELASSYSRAWRENAAAVDVYWVKPEQVSPQAPSGEYMARGMFMIHGPRNYMRGTPLRVAVGALFEDGTPRIIGGPPSAVKSKTSILVEIVPGREQSGKLAKRIRDALTRRSPEQHRRALAGLPLEEIQTFIPAGRGEIASR